MCRIARNSGVLWSSSHAFTSKFTSAPCSSNNSATTQQLLRDRCHLFLLTRATLMATPLGQVEVQHFRDQLVTEAPVSEYRLSLLQYQSFCIIHIHRCLKFNFGWRTRMKRMEGVVYRRISRRPALALNRRRRRALSKLDQPAVSQALRSKALSQAAKTH